MFYATKAKRRSIKVKEWGKELFFTPICLADFDKVAQLMEGNDGSVMARQVYLLIFKAQDKAGKRVLNIGDYDGLMTKADPFVLARVIGFMGGETPEETKAELGKNQSASDI